jgi:hypothetical protein
MSSTIDANDAVRTSQYRSNNSTSARLQVRGRQVDLHKPVRSPVSDAYFIRPDMGKQYDLG